MQQLGGANVLPIVGHSDAVEILRLIRDRTRQLTPADLDQYWHMALDASVELCEHAAELPNAPIDELFSIASEWGAQPLSIERAAVAARRIRGSAFPP